MPFGKTSIIPVLGQNNDAHYGWGGIVAAPSGQLIQIYRKASHHGTTDGAEARIRFSQDGKSWHGDRVLYFNALCDARPDAPRLFANGRIGVLINRASAANGHFSPIVIFSDDEFVAHEVTKTISLSSPYTFSSTGGWIEFPASQGGHDVNGFICFGFASANGLDAITTTDNLETFQVVHEVAQASGASTSLSEWSGVKIPGEEKWVFYLRNKDANGWRNEAACFVTTNLLNWGTMLPSGKNIGGNPPFAFVDQVTSRIYFGTFARAGRGVDGYDHHMLVVSATPAQLSAANGNWASIAPAWEVVTPVPNWATGYFSHFIFNGKMAGVFTCAESGGTRSAMAIIGDFTNTDADRTKWFDLFNRDAIMGALRLGYGLAYSPAVPARLSMSIDANTAGVLTQSFGSVSRKHIIFHTSLGEAGNISAAGSTVTYST